MQDRPTALELIAATRAFLASEMAPACTDQRLKFRALIAANVLAIAERELVSGDQPLHESIARLQSLGMGATLDADATPTDPCAVLDRQLRELCAAIRAGLKDEREDWQAVFDFALWHVEAKLRVANPRYLQKHANMAPIGAPSGQNTPGGTA